MPFREMNREQMWMLPPTLGEMVPMDHPARFVAEFVDGMKREDWAELGVDADGDPMGAPAYHPRALLSVWLYGFMTGVRSTRKLETACRDQIPYLWLTGLQRPDHNTLWRFYKNHRQAMRNLFKRTVRTAFRMELVDLALQAVDGTKVRANAANDRTYDGEALRRLSERSDRAICALEAQNEAGEDAPPANLPPELAGKKALRERMRQAQETLEGSDRLKQVNLTDQDAVMMKTNQGITLAYNGQAVVSPVVAEGKETGMLITAAGVSDDPTDYAQLGPMMKQAEETTGVRAETTLADGGYYSGSNLEECARRGQQVIMPEGQRQALDSLYHKDRFDYDEANDRYRCPEGRWLSFFRINRGRRTMTRIYRGSVAVCLSCPAFGVCTKSKRHGRTLKIGPQDAALRRHRAWMSTEEAKRAYRQRKLLVEPVFGIIKEQLQARSFLLRRSKQRCGRVVPAGYSLQPAHPVAYMADPGAGPRVHKRSATPNQAAQARSGQVSTDKRRGISYMCDPGDRCRNDGVSNPPAHTNDAETPGHKPRTLIRQAPRYGAGAQGPGMDTVSTRDIDEHLRSPPLNPSFRRRPESRGLGGLPPSRTR